MELGNLPNIDDLTLPEKIGLMELLWRDISREPENVEVPQWHRKILNERERAVANGEEEFIDLDEAMDQVRRSIKSGRHG